MTFHDALKKARTLAGTVTDPQVRSALWETLAKLEDAHHTDLTRASEHAKAIEARLKK